MKYDDFPDVRDGLTRTERVILYCLHQLQREFEPANVPSVTLYGRVVEYLDISPREFEDQLQHLTQIPNAEGEANPQAKKHDKK